MVNAIKLLIRVVKRRIEAGEDLDTIMADYPKLSQEQIEEVRDAAGGGKEAEERA